MAKASDNKFPKVILEEVLDDGSATTTPAADHRALFLGEDGTLRLKDSSAAVTDVAGGGGGAPLGITRYAPGSEGAPHASTTSATLVDVDATNALVTFTAPASGNVIVTLTMAVLSSGANQNFYFGLRESTSIIAGPHMVSNNPTANYLSVLSRDFYLTGISAGAHTYKAAYAIQSGGTLGVYIGPTQGPIEMTVWAA